MLRHRYNRAQKRQLKKMGKEGYAPNIKNVMAPIEESMLIIRGKLIANPTAFDPDDVEELLKIREEMNVEQMTCVVHKQNIEVWHDCSRCLEQAVKWSKENGLDNYDQWVIDNSRRHKVKLQTVKSATALLYKLHIVLQRLDPHFCWLKKK